MAALLGAGALASLATAAGGSHRTILVSRAAGTHGVKGDSDSQSSSVSADGRFVAFQSQSANLSSADPNHNYDVYVRDLVSHRTILVSRATGTHGAKGDDSSDEPSISANGRFVAFRSASHNLSTADTDGTRDIFRRDLRRHRTILVSRANGSRGQKGNSDSREPVISGDGRSVAFTSQANNLSSADDDFGSDIYVRQLRRHRTLLASRENGTGGRRGNNDSVQPSISGDGRSVAFETVATNLSSADTIGDNDVYVRQLRRHRTLLASRKTGAGGVKGNSDSRSASISADGRSVAFQSNANNLSSADTSFDRDIYVRQLGRHRTLLASRATGADGAKGDDNSFAPSLSGDGRTVAFVSVAKNLSSADPGLDFDIYVRVLNRHRTSLASRRNGPHGGAGDPANANDPSISADGRTVAFESPSADFSSADSDIFVDIYVRTGPF